MPKLNFPASPTPGTLYTENGNTWKWNGTSWISFNSLDLTSQVSGALGTTYGGTGFSTFDSGDLLVGLGGTLYKLPIGSNSQILSVDSTLDHKIKWINNTGGSGSGTVFYGNLYEIPFYTSGFAITGSPNFINIGTGISILYATNSNSTSSGALVVNGGVGISANLNVGGEINGLKIASGVVTSGSWSGNAITSAYGGFGAIPIVNKGDILVGSGNTWYNVPYSASNNNVLLVDTSQPFGVKWAAIPAAGSTSVTVSSTDNNGPFYLTFVDSSSGSGLALSADTDLNYNASSNSLSLGNLIASSNVAIGQTLIFSNLSNFYTVGFKASTSTGATVVYVLPDNLPQGSGTSVLKSDLNGFLSWVPMTASGGGSGNSVYIAPDPPISSNSGDLWWDNVDGSLSLYYNDGDSSQWVEIVNAFVGMATTTVELAAKTERAFTIDVSSASASTSYFLTFVKPNLGSGLALSSGVGLSFNPSTNTLTTENYIGTLGTSNQPNITGLGTISSGTWAGSVITSFYGGTGLNLFSSGDLLVGLGTSLYKLPVGSNKNILQVVGSSLSGLAWTSYNTNTISSSAPANPSTGDFWWNNEDGSLSIYYNDGNSNQWVEVISGYSGIDASKDLKLTSSTASTNLSTGALVITGGVGVGNTLNAATIGINNVLENIALTYTASTTSSNQISHSVDALSYRTLKYLVQVSCGTSFDSSEILIVHDGTNTSIKQNSQVLIGTGISLSSYSSDVSSNNLRLKVSPLVAPSVYNISCMAIRV